MAKAEVILGGWPFPLDLRARSPNLKWFHQRPAGASNLMRGDLWNSDVVATTSRGAGNTLAMAEYALAGVMHFAKGLPRTAADHDAGCFNHRAYLPLLMAGKTMCVVGVGGIGGDVGRLSAALGMRVVGGSVAKRRAKSEISRREDQFRTGAYRRAASACPRWGAAEKTQGAIFRTTHNNKLYLFDCISRSARYPQGGKATSMPIDQACSKSVAAAGVIFPSVQLPARQIA